ncbi:hypothetical protein SO802_012092 [Lithocarpus litseifolius]|uniref:DC1 domain-containing protein n=1 Tax=Lithocarpus litseifolius TaxID=425828 RepID=A0AAW2D5Q5_9ROSI
MGRESIEEGELSTPLVAKEEHHQLYGSSTSSGDHACANTTGCDDGGESQSGSSSGVVVLCTLVAVSGSYVFGTATMELQHWRHWQHPLVFNEDERSGRLCYGCTEPVFGPSYSCVGRNCNEYYDHHESCAELTLGLHHPSHPNHPLILFCMYTYNDEEYDKFSKCDVCGEKSNEYSYCCYRCNFNIHIRCSSLSLTIQTEVHDHQLTRIWKLMKFTCDFCGKEGNLPYCCVQCDFAIHSHCAACPRRLKVFRDNHPLHLTPSLQVHQSNSPICLLCVEKELKEEQSTDSKTEDPGLHQSFDSEICKVIKTTVGEDGIEIAIEIKHDSHEHNLKLTDEIPNNTKCNGACAQLCNGLKYNCQTCNIDFNVQCISLSNTLTHACHEHRLYLSITNSVQKCSICSSGKYRVFRCATCDFVLDFKCATLPLTTWYNQHEHPFTLCYTPEDNSAFLLIATVFLGKIQMSRNTYNGHQLGGATQ